jgi:polysaccharide deacetylase family protein (PEP-CTERM system associated)
VTFVLTVDFEDWHQLVYRRIGREDWITGSPAFERHVEAVLDLLDEVDVSATFFVVGATAERHPAALREVVSRGHELGCHGYEHRRAHAFTRMQFREDVRRCLDVVDDLCGVRPTGFRAPWFSITAETRWVHQELEELGFRYDSSLYDSPLLRERLRQIPAHPFRLGALWEFPVAVWKTHGVIVPIGGGSYWRMLPETALWHGLESVGRDSGLPVLYFHPYEFAPEPLEVVLPAGSARRDRTRERYRRLSKNARRTLIPGRVREAAGRFRFVSFRQVMEEGAL